MSSTVKATLSVVTTQDSDLMTLVYISLLLLHNNILKSFDANPSLEVRGVAFSLIFLKHLTEFDMKVSFVNSRVMELTVTSLNLLNHF